MPNRPTPLPDHPEAIRVSDALIGLWGEQLQTREGRALMLGVLCRAMRVVALPEEGGCGDHCPLAGHGGRDIADQLSDAATRAAAIRELADQVVASVERAELMVEGLRE